MRLLANHLDSTEKIKLKAGRKNVTIQTNYANTKTQSIYIHYINKIQIIKHKKLQHIINQKKL